MRLLLVALATLAGLANRVPAADLVAATNGTDFNVGSEVGLRIVSGNASKLSATIRYAGEDQPLAHDLAIKKSSDFSKLWTIPIDARTGRYEVDLNGQRNITSFAVYRKSARIAHVDVERTFYTNGDSINCRVVIRNLLDRPLENLRVEFGPFYYPWIAPAPDDPKFHTTVLAESLSLPPGGEQELKGEGVAVAYGPDHTTVSSYSVTIWDQKREHVYDLAFTAPIFSRPAATKSPKQYPFLYLYPTLADVASRAMAYRNFYPAEYISNSITFDTAHTIFRSGADPQFSFHVKAPEGVNLSGASIVGRVLDSAGKEVQKESPVALGSGSQQHAKIKTLPDGRYVYEVSLLAANGTPVATNKLEFALDALPNSILIFCAHQDDDTAHPALIRAAVENQIPIHFIYFTSGDAGGCDRYYMAACDPSRAMDYGETRMEESRASLGHLGVAPENISFLGLPDGGMEEIWLNHHSEKDPYLSVLLASDHAPYKNLVRPNLPFAREPILEQVKGFIRKYQPELIVTGHPEERHVDHRTNNWLVVSAMQSLLKEGSLSPKTRMLVDLSYGGTSWIHSPYKYEKQLFYVPAEVAKLGQEALWFYQTQDGNHEQGDLVKLADLPRGEAYPHLWLLDWQQHAGWNEENLAKIKHSTK